MCKKDSKSRGQGLYRGAHAGKQKLYWSTELKNREPAPKLPEFRSWLSLTGWPWASDLTFLCLKVLTYKIGLIIVLMLEVVVRIKWVTIRKALKTVQTQYEHSICVSYWDYYVFGRKSTTYLFSWRRGGRSRMAGQKQTQVSWQCELSTSPAFPCVHPGPRSRPGPSPSSASLRKPLPLPHSWVPKPPCIAALQYCLVSPFTLLHSATPTQLWIDYRRNEHTCHRLQLI